MIERLLVAERALAEGHLDQAELLFRQVADADERNAIAVVGLAEVELARGDREAAVALARRALAIDPEDAAASRIASARTDRTAAAAAPAAAVATVPAVAAAPAATTQPATPAAPVEPTAPPPQPRPEPAPPSPTRPSLGARLRAWLRRLGGRVP